MTFEHNPGLAALHRHITGEQPAPVPTEETMVSEPEAKAEVEAIARDIQQDVRLKSPRRKGFGG